MVTFMLNICILIACAKPALIVSMSNVQPNYLSKQVNLTIYNKGFSMSPMIRSTKKKTNMILHEWYKTFTRQSKQGTNEGRYKNSPEKH